MAKRETADGQTGLFDRAAEQEEIERISRQARERIATSPQAPRNDKDGGRIATAPQAPRNDEDRADEGHRPLRRKADVKCASLQDGSVWEMKKRGSVGVVSTVPNCGYSEAALRSLRERGWHLYKDGKRLD